MMRLLRCIGGDKMSKIMTHKEYILSEIEDLGQDLVDASECLNSAGLKLKDIVRHIIAEMKVMENE